MQHAQTPSKPQIPRLRRKKKKATAELASEKISLPVSPLRPHPLPLFPQTRLRSTRGCTLLPPPTPILSPFVASARTTPNTTAATRAPLQVCPTSSSSSARARGGGLADGRHGTARSKGRANRAEKREKRAAQKKNRRQDLLRIGTPPEHTTLRIRHAYVAVRSGVEVSEHPLPPSLAATSAARA